MFVAANDRAARHAREGTQAATRKFCDIRLHSATAADAQNAVIETLAHWEAGSAPVAFKEAARTKFVGLFERTYGLSLYRTPAHAVLSTWSEHSG